jgi:hypothetical protein
MFFVEASILALCHRLFTQTELQHWNSAVAIFVAIYTVAVS